MSAAIRRLPEKATAAMALHLVAEKVIECELELLREHGATDPELSEHRRLRNSELAEWFERTKRQAIAAVCE
ncbi:hypothetical protein [Nitratireductor sp. GCM10026969]|uniref:hypothetical protein n=1 Tax=Nitratireductor sp. GCM10026969 TaxID=3252645 RepID=UPI00361F577F